MADSSILFYRTADGQTSIDVKLENETVWLTRRPLAVLFDRDIKTIGKHIKNALNEELKGIPVVAKFATTAADGKTYNTEHYNIEMITSVGYRVKSRQGTLFRIWANSILKEYLIKGYAVNQRLQLQNYTELKQLVQVLGRTVRYTEQSDKEETYALISVVSDYAYALSILDRYDNQTLDIESKTTSEDKFHITYTAAVEIVARLKEEFETSPLFGNEKDDSFKSSIGQIYQTYDGVDLYPSVEEKAAMLLYLVTKNHSFSDGNKRIAAATFLWFLANNGILYNLDGSKRIADNTLVALTLMIAESRTEEKDVMVKVVVNLINKNN